MAVAETLIESASLCLFVTHFAQIVSLSQLYGEVKNVHLISSTSPSPGDQSRANLNHKLCAGPSTETSGYGIALAKTCGFPDEVVDDANFISTKLVAQYPLLIDKNGPAQLNSIMSGLLSKLLLLKNSTLDNDGVRSYLQNIRSTLGTKEVEMLATALNSTNPDTSSPSSKRTAERGMNSFQAG
jgi:DNA mismatch repair ATPase MutS